MAATINFTITSPTEGIGWSGSISINETTATTVSSSTYTNIDTTYSGSTISFTPTQFRAFPAANQSSYVTWRTQAISSQYPTTGRSLDVWSEDLYTAIVTNSATWATLVAQTAGYTLNTGKWCLSYDYDGPYAYAWCKGGTITFT